MKYEHISKGRKQFSFFTTIVIGLSINSPISFLTLTLLHYLSKTQIEMKKKKLVLKKSHLMSLTDQSLVSKDMENVLGGTRLSPTITLLSKPCPWTSVVVRCNEMSTLPPYA